jgi:hypothetical protein
MKLWVRLIIKWLPLAVFSVGVCGLVYITDQQSLRMNANDPQIQMAQDTARALASGAAVDALLPSQKVDLTKSLAPFLIVYAADGKVIASSAELNGQTPDLPTGVLDSTRQSGENRLTWQPESGVRIAAVIVANNSGFVLAGRSLLEVEKRESQAELLSGLALIAILTATFLFVAAGEIFSNRIKAS